jgi:DNA-directed RNA polymerase specialized sigma24 family protein
MTSFGPKRATSRTSLLPHTPWTQLMRSRGGDTVANDALGHVVGLYWRPIHVCIQKRGFAQHDAEDLTQEFLSNIVQKGHFDRVDPAKGKLRSYVLTALNHFLANAWRARDTQRRGSGATHLSLDAEPEEGGAPLDLPDLQTPDVEFDREWALTVLDNVMKELCADYAQQGKQALFDAISPALSVVDGQTDAHAMGEKLGMNAGAVRVAIHRLRLRYRNMLYRHIAATVEREDQVEGEIRDMILMLRRK